MPFDRPTLADLITRVGSDIDSRMSGTDSKLRRSNTAVIARASAGLAHGQYGYLGWIALQIFASTCDDEQLVIEGSEYGLTKNPATFATGTLDVPGNNGAVIPAETIWQRSDGVEYRATADATIVNGSAAVSISSVVAGIAGNCAAGTALEIVVPIDGVEVGGTTAAPGILYGSDIEGTESFRARVLEYKRHKPAGGNKYDYVTWALQVPGVARAWVVPMGQGPGTVDLVVVADQVSTGSEMPDAELLTAVRALIDDQAPTDVKYLRVLPWIPKPLDLTIQVVPNTVAVKTAVLAELADLVAREGENQGTIPVSHINEAIALASGVTDQTLTVPAGPFVYTAYERVVLGVVTWL